MTCDHDRGFDLMDRCRSCGHQLSDDELREREYAELRSLRESRPRDDTPGADDAVALPGAF